MQQGPGQGPQGYPQQPPQKQGMSTLAKVLIALLVIGVTGVGGCVVCAAVGVGAAGKAITDAADSAKKVDESAKAATKDVAIKQLLEDYKGNEVRADEAYKNKYITTAGFVQDVKKDITDSIYITLAPTRDAQFMIPVLQCMPSDAQKGEAAKLNKGDSVAITGKVDGLILNVLVSNCEIKATKAPGAPAQKPKK